MGGGAVRQLSSAVLEYVEMRAHQVANRQCISDSDSIALAKCMLNAGAADESCVVP